MQVNQLSTDNEKLKQDNAKLQAALEKQKKEMYSKAELYKNKTEQFQSQWRKREECEKLIEVIIQHVPYLVFLHKLHFITKALIIYL